MPYQVFAAIQALDPEVQVTFLVLRCICWRSRWPPQPGRLARFRGCSVTDAARHLDAIRVAGFFTDQWLGRGIFYGPKAHVTVRALRVLLDLGLPPLHRIMLLRLLVDEEDGLYRYDPRNVLRLSFYPDGEIRSALRTFRQLDLIGRRGEVALFLRRPS